MNSEKLQRCEMEELAVIEAAKRVKGVRGIVVDIEVACPPEYSVPDEQIAERATQVLAWKTEIPRDAVKITVEDGCMTLSGTVDWQFQRQVIEEDLRGLAGVVAVKNEIAIRRVSCTNDIRHSITDAVHRRAYVEAARMHVAIDEAGRVVLKGKVAGWRARNAIEDAAWLVTGVKNVDNRVTVR